MAPGGRQRWVLDADAVAGDDGRRRPDFARRTDAAVRLARLRAERDAVAPDAEARLRVLDAQLRLGGLPSRSRRPAHWVADDVRPPLANAKSERDR